MDSRRIVAYSLLAHINNGSRTIPDLGEIFVPLIKHVLNNMVLGGVSKGQSLDIQERIKQEFGLDMPFPLIARFLKRIANEASIKETQDIQLFGDSAFIIHKFTFVDTQQMVQEQSADIAVLEEAYQAFVLARGSSLMREPSLFEFLDQNRVSLSSFFASNSFHPSGALFSLQADFVNEIKSRPTLFGTLRRVYLGSIISCYLEGDFGPPSPDSTELLLDTSFVVRLLDLSSIEAHHTCKTVLELCRRSGFSVSVMDITVEETKSLIERTADRLSTSFFGHLAFPEDIMNACRRRELKKTDLQRIANRLEDTLRGDDLNIYIIPHTKDLQEAAKRSAEYTVLSRRHNNPGGALHDATALKYVQRKRNRAVKKFSQARCWFVSTGSLEPEIARMYGDNLPDMIRPEELVNVMWLSNPISDRNTIDEIGLSRLVSATIDQGMPSQRTMRELDENVRLYAKDELTADDLVYVATAVAERTVNVDELNRKAETKTEEFVEDLHSIAERKKTEEARFKERIGDMLNVIESGYDQKRGEYEENLKSTVAKIREVEQQAGQKIREAQAQVTQNRINDLRIRVREIELTLKDNIRRSTGRVRLEMGLVHLPLAAFVGWFVYTLLSSATDKWTAGGTIVATACASWAVLWYSLSIYKLEEWKPVKLWKARRDEIFVKYCSSNGVSLELKDSIVVQINSLEDEIVAEERA